MWIRKCKRQITTTRDYMPLFGIGWYTENPNILYGSYKKNMSILRPWILRSGRSPGRRGSPEFLLHDLRAALPQPAASTDSARRSAGRGSAAGTEEESLWTDDEWSSEPRNTEIREEVSKKNMRPVFGIFDRALHIGCETPLCECTRWGLTPTVYARA